MTALRHFTLRPAATAARNRQHLGYLHERNASSIELHENSNHGVIVGLSREF